MEFLKTAERERRKTNPTSWKREKKHQAESSEIRETSRYFQPAQATRQQEKPTANNQVASDPQPSRTVATRNSKRPATSELSTPGNSGARATPIASHRMSLRSLSEVANSRSCPRPSSKSTTYFTWSPSGKSFPRMDEVRPCSERRPPCATEAGTEIGPSPFKEALEATGILQGVREDVKDQVLEGFGDSSASIQSHSPPMTKECHDREITKSNEYFGNLLLRESRDLNDNLDAALSGADPLRSSDSSKPRVPTKVRFATPNLIPFDDSLRDVTAGRCDIIHPELNKDGSHFRNVVAWDGTSSTVYQPPLGLVQLDTTMGVNDNEVDVSADGLTFRSTQGYQSQKFTPQPSSFIPYSQQSTPWGTYVSSEQSRSHLTGHWPSATGPPPFIRSDLSRPNSRVDITDSCIPRAVHASSSLSYSTNDWAAAMAAPAVEGDFEDAGSKGKYQPITPSQSSEHITEYIKRIENEVLAREYDPEILESYGRHSSENTVSQALGHNLLSIPEAPQIRQSQPMETRTTEIGRVVASSYEPRVTLETEFAGISEDISTEMSKFWRPNRFSWH